MNAAHEKFRYATPGQLTGRAAELGVHIPYSENTGILFDNPSIAGIRLANRLGIAPLEAADSMPDGSPSERTFRRYMRYARGGAGLIWVEAVAITPRSRNGTRQLMLTEHNLDQFRRFVSAVREAGVSANGFAPYLVIQAHHSGRFSAPDGVPAPQIACRHPLLDRDLPISDKSIISDDELRRVEDDFSHFAALAKAAGFDAVDVKCCHGYLLGEMTSAYDRPGEYGGSFENRTRLIRNCVAAAAVHSDPSFSVTARLGIYDGPAWPLGFGVSRGSGDMPDMTEPAMLVRELHVRHGMKMINLSVGNPCIFRHYNRPYDKGSYVPDEHPLISVARIFRCIGEVKRAVPDMFVSASGLSYLRQFAGGAAAGAVHEGLFDHALMGRMAFADPDFPRQLRMNGVIDPSRTCVTCSRCEDLLCSGIPAGCVVRADRPE